MHSEKTKVRLGRVNEDVRPTQRTRSHLLRRFVFYMRKENRTRGISVSCFSHFKNIVRYISKLSFVVKF